MSEWLKEAVLKIVRGFTSLRGSNPRASEFHGVMAESGLKQLLAKESGSNPPQVQILFTPKFYFST